MVGMGGHSTCQAIGCILSGSLGRHARMFDRVSLCAFLALSIMLADAGPLQAQSPARRSLTPADVIVTLDNFRRAETNLIFADLVNRNGLGRFVHQREFQTIESPAARPSRDTLLSAAVFDLDAAPVTITLPDAGYRFISMHVVDEDQYTSAVHYGAGTHALAKEQVGTRYIYVGVRMMAASGDPGDVKAVHTLQDAIQVVQKGGPGTFQVPNFDPVSQMRVRMALSALSRTVPDTKRMFGTRDQVDPIRHLIGTAIGFGGASEKEIHNLHVTPRKNDGFAIYKLTARDVPVDGFWSISVYNAEGRFVRNMLDAYTVNSITAKKGHDTSVVVQFGGCDGKIANCLPTPVSWNYLVRLYRPRPEILDGTWIFPQAQPLN